MTDTLETLEAEWEQRRNYDPYAMIKRVFTALEDAEKKLDTYREWHLRDRRQVNALREALQPFADVDLTALWSDDYVPSANPGESITVGALRRARRVLEETAS